MLAGARPLTKQATLMSLGKRGSGDKLREVVSDAFMSGLHAGCLTAAGVCLVGAVAVLAFLPAHPTRSRTAREIAGVSGTGLVQ